MFEEQQSGLCGRSPMSKVRSIPKTSEVGDRQATQGLGAILEGSKQGSDTLLTSVLTVSSWLLC